MEKMLKPIPVYIDSVFLKRTVRADVYTNSHGDPKSASLLLINDGQDLVTMNFEDMLQKMVYPGKSLVAVGIHAGEDRKQEYGVIGLPDYMGRGSKAGDYARFLLEELMPVVHQRSGIDQFQRKACCGFSLGGLMAFDMAMEYPAIFNACGVFSGSFWWRSKALEEGYVEERDRIMHAKLRTKRFTAGQRFFLQTGQLDEKADRNKNGIIDSIDDTLGIIIELKKLGFEDGKEIRYEELPDGSHDIKTWSRVMPVFLDWLLAASK
jgi:enterochelin esterase-like enzyme